LKKIHSYSDKVWKSITFIGGALLFINVLIIIANIIARRFLNAPILGSTEYVQYLSLLSASLALAQNEWFNGNIKMSLFLEMMSDRLRRIFVIGADLISSAAFCFVSYLLVKQAVNKYIVADVTSTLKLPMWVFAAFLAFGVILLTICLILKMIINATEFFMDNNVDSCMS